MRRHLLGVIVAALGLAAPALAEEIRKTDSFGREWVQDGEHTCMFINSTYGVCGRTVGPLVEHIGTTMQPTHDCTRPIPADPWECRPRVQGLSPAERAVMLQWLLSHPVTNPGLEAGRNSLRSLCLSGGGTVDPATGTCYTPPPRPPVQCRTRSMGGGNWETTCD